LSDGKVIEITMIESLWAFVSYWCGFQI
jgi:hypothetical protein